MNNRRDFLATLGGALAASTALGTPEVATTGSVNGDDRRYWVKTLLRVAEPVLASLAANQLKVRMPVETPATQPQSRQPATYLEALGRTLNGLAPWLELDSPPADEAPNTRRLAAMARQAIANITDPQAADFVNFSAAGQCLVDAAFLSHAMLRAPRELWSKHSATVQQRVLEALESTRKTTPGNNNWLLFSAMVETFLATAGREWRPEPVDRAITAHESWYKGDGTYGDGPEWHWDYYNSFVIQPMLVDVLEHIGKVTPRWAGHLPRVLARARRYAAVQERLIAPDGSYPVIGRSIVYRCGAFQLLAQMALRDQLPGEVTPAQARCALAAVIRRTMDAPDTFDANGWLRAGLSGHQPKLAESYISTGSLYLCTFAFLPLGLPVGHAFWSSPSTDWTSRKAWSGQDLSADQAYQNGG